jgi:hypothetical protein
MKKPDILKQLARTDKWYLGGGNRLLWAPPFPIYLDFPGFWDEAHYYNYELKPLFTWALLDDEGEEIPVRFQSRSWKPSVLMQEYLGQRRNSKSSIQILESKAVLPNDVATSVVHFRNPSGSTIKLHFLAWTTQEHLPSKESTWLADIAYRHGVMSFKKFLRPSVDPFLELACAFALNRKPTSQSVNLSERTALQPRWQLSPWFETFAGGKLPNEMKLSGVTNEGLLYLGLHTEVLLRPTSEASVAVAFAVAPSADETMQNLHPVLRRADPIELSDLSWEDHFSSVPFFQASDEFLTRYYWYRWYGLRLNTIYGVDGNYKRPFVCEGIAYFRAPITYSAQCHMLENRWMHDPELAQGSLLVFLDNQREDGGFRGYIDVNHYRQETFYHANWGDALLQLHNLHPSADYLQSIYDGLKRYAGYFDRERDEEISGLYDIDNHYETGQEYMHRYTAVNPQADQENWGEVFRLKGVDVTTYVYALKRALAFVAEHLGRSDEAELWKLEAEKIKTAVLLAMWDSDEEMFFDVDPATGKRTMVKAATSFYPYFTDIVDESHLPGLKRHLLNPKEFWTPFPVPSSSADDELFSAAPEWKGKRMNCPWNGRVWPMTNSHIAEVLGQSAVRFGDQLLRKKTAEFITKFIRMMFFDADPERPNCFEHYNPITGKPSVYRGIDDYQHSWVNDLIIKYVCGIRPDEFSVTIDPFPFGLKHALIDNALVRGRRLKVEIEGKKFGIWLDGKQQAESTIGKKIQIQI